MNAKIEKLKKPRLYPAHKGTGLTRIIDKGGEIILFPPLLGTKWQLHPFWSGNYILTS
jgi:hypothetical protein